MKDQYAVYLCKPMEEVRMVIYGKRVFVASFGASTLTDACQQYAKSRYVVITKQFYQQLILDGEQKKVDEFERMVASLSSIRATKKSFWQKLKSFFY
jgi:hypothetical protein